MLGLHFGHHAVASALALALLVDEPDAPLVAQVVDRGANRGLVAVRELLGQGRDADRLVVAGQGRLDELDDLLADLRVRAARRLRPPRSGVMTAERLERPVDALDEGLGLLQLALE